MRSDDDKVLNRSTGGSTRRHRHSSRDHSSREFPYRTHDSYRDSRYGRADHPSRYRSRSRGPRRHARSRDRSHDRHRRSLSPPSRRAAKPLPSQQDAFNSNSTSTGSTTSDKPPEKEKPNFGQTGRLAAESNTVVTAGGAAVVLKYHEPPEARKPPPSPPAPAAWRLYVFKGDSLLETLQLGDRSCWLVGRDAQVVDLPAAHPSISGQHAALQFRYMEKRNEYGDRKGRVRLYVIDLESSNGTVVNGEAVPTGRYFELRDKDVLQFGLSEREYVVMLA